MAKRYKGGRRQILQLEDKKASRDENEPSSTAPVHKTVVPLDSQVADFFKEIDALGVNDETSEFATVSGAIDTVTSIHEGGEGSSELENDAKPGEKSEDIPEASPKGISCSWQEICDETSGYNYYWNVETNEVTWDCPVEYAEYLKNACSSNSKNLPSSSGRKKSFKATKKKKKSNDHTVGAIIPITYFGGSSSDESSDESCEQVPSTTYKKSALKSRLSENLKPEINALSLPSEVMGPQLPPHFQFPKRSENKSESTDDSSKNEVEEFLEFGPKLPSNHTRSSSVIGTESSNYAVSASTSISGPNMNGTLSASSLNGGYNESLISNNGKSDDDSVEIGKESPDSTVKKLDDVSDPPVREEKESVLSYGCRLVVEYDSFTDDDDQDISNISSSKNYALDEPKTTSEKNGDPTLNEKISEKHFESLSSKKESFNLKRNYASIFTTQSNSKRSKMCDQLDIESLFSMNASHGKFGFGFNREQKLDLENTLKCAKEQVSASSSAINFVKSDHVFNLNTINENPPSSETEKPVSPNSVLPSDSEMAKDSEIKTEIKPVIALEDNISVGENSNSLENNLNSDANHCNLQNTPVVLDFTSSEPYITTIKDKIEFEEKSPQNSMSATNDISFISSEESNFTDNSTLPKPSISSKMAATLSKFEKEIDEIGRALGMKSESAVGSFAFGTSSSQKSGMKKGVSFATSKKENELAESIRVDSATHSEFPATPTVSDPSNENIMEPIVDLSSLLLEKLSFLVSGHTTLNILSVFLIQIQTRLMDWQLGVLENKHFLDRLQEVNQYLLQYETSCVSGDWICQWDRVNKRYFYTNRRKQASQWSYPAELLSQKLPPWACNLSSENVASSCAVVLAEKHDQPVSSSIPENRLQSCSSTTLTDKAHLKGNEHSWVLQSSPPPRPPGVDSPSPPPPPCGPPDSPPPPPPDSTDEKFSIPQDMELENSNDSSPSFITIQDINVSKAQALYGENESHSTNQLVNTEVHLCASNAVSSTSVTVSDEGCDASRLSQSPATFSNNFDALNVDLSQVQPSCSTSSSVNLNYNAEDIRSSVELSSECMNSEIVASSSTTSMPVANSKTGTCNSSKSERKKSKISSGLALKKKNIPSLVQKWEMVRKVLDDEEHFS